LQGLLIVDPVPILMEGVTIRVCPRTRPGVEDTTAKCAVLVTPLVYQRFADVKDALQSQPKAPHFAGISALGPSNSGAQARIVSLSKGPVVGDHEGWPAEEAVAGFGPTLVQHQQDQFSCPSVVCILDEFAHDGAPISRGAVDIS